MRIAAPTTAGTSDTALKGKGRCAWSRSVWAMPYRLLAAFLIALFALHDGAGPVGAVAATPFSYGASAGPQAGARVEATVTRMVSGVRETLPAAVVPALAPGDEVVVRFPDFTRPAAHVNYHVDVAFITEVAPQRWLYERSGPQDQLFQNRRRAAPASPSLPELRFTYGVEQARGIPIFFIVPEDDKTRGMDGVRDYVDAHPTDFKNMAESANAAVDRYTWFADFLQSLGNGSIDPLTSQRRVEDVAASLGAAPATVDACYAAGATQSQVASCVQTTLQSTQYQPNLDAPTQAQFFGGLAGAASPLSVATYLLPLLSLWKIFAYTGHREFEYLPATLALAQPASLALTGELLMGLKVPTLRPPAAYSSALFFTIGDPQAAASAPAVVDDADATGVCARGDRVVVPLHLDRTSPYVNATSLVVTPDGKPARTIALDPRSIDAPLVSRAQLDDGSAAGYSVRLAGRFGFDPIGQPARPVARVALPRETAWSVQPAPHRVPTAGGTLDVVAASSAAPCLSSAELQIGSAPPLALALTHLDDRRVALHASLANVPAGPAHVRLVQDDPLHGTQIEGATVLAIASKPAQIESASVPVARLGDTFIALRGTGFEGIAGVRVGGATYEKTPSSTSSDACFTGPAFGSNARPDQSISAQLVPSDGSPGEVFEMRVGQTRPTLLPATTLATASPRLSTDAFEATLSTHGGPLPLQREVRIRQAQATASPCETVQADPVSAVVPENDARLQSPSSLAVVLRPAQELGDRAFGTLQVQVRDTRSDAASAWTDVPGTSVRAPSVTKIECTADPAAPCTMIGSGLSSIVGVVDGSGRVVTPSLDCVSDVKGQSCRSVPHVPHYVLHLEDAGATTTVPDSALGQPHTPPAAPAPAVTASAAARH